MYKLAQIIRNVAPPAPINSLGSGIGGISVLGTILVRILIFGAGLYALFNIILAGYAYFAAGDDPKKVQGASGKILQSLIGLLFAAGSLVLAAIFGKLIFNDYRALLQIKVFGP